jgi:hypothetical protein
VESASRSGHVADRRDCATEPPPRGGPFLVVVRWIVRSTMRHRRHRGCRRQGSNRLSGAKVSGSEPRRYFTNFNKGRCSASGAGSVSAGGSSANIASHRAFNSESPIRLSLILMSRMATPTNRAVSRLPLSMRPARHSSSVIRIECSFCSESANGFLPLPNLRVGLV